MVTVVTAHCDKWILATRTIPYTRRARLFLAVSRLRSDSNNAK